ncbi:MAG: galactose-1-phosphate uridylyltransferase [Candidatus Binatia bacterium]
MSEFTKDPLTGRGVIIAPERGQRPNQFDPTSAAESAQPCPFCTGNERQTPPESWANRPADSAPDRPGWSIRVVPNKYPAVTADVIADGQTADRSAGAGIHEVIIETAAHVANLAALGEAQFSKIFRAYRGRLRAVREDRRWRFALIFKNQGERAGATLEHAHAQLLALPFVPADVEQELAGARDYHRRNASCYYCALIERELEAQVRVVTSSAAFIALCPAAPRFAFETWILPRVHGAAFEHADDSTIAALAKISRQAITALDHLQANPPFNYYIQSLPLADSERAHYHWQLRLLPQFSRAAGFEWGSGIHINPVAPEAAAQVLRDALI